MNKLTIAKFGGSAIGIDGEGIPDIVKRVKDIQKDSKVMVVCSAPLTMINGEKRSLTDIVLGIGNNAAKAISFDFSINTFSVVIIFLICSNPDFNFSLPSGAYAFLGNFFDRFSGRE